MSSFEKRMPYRTEWEDITTIGTVLALGKMTTRIERHGNRHFAIAWPTRQPVEAVSEMFIKTFMHSMDPRKKVALNTQALKNRPPRDGEPRSTIMQDGKVIDSYSLLPPERHKHKLCDVQNKVLEAQSDANPLMSAEIGTQDISLRWSSHGLDTCGAGEIVLSTHTDKPTVDVFKPLFEATAVPELRDLTEEVEGEVIATSRRLLLGGEQADSMQRLAETLGAIANNDRNR